MRESSMASTDSTIASATGALTASLAEASDLGIGGAVAELPEVKAAMAVADPITRVSRSGAAQDAARAARVRLLRRATRAVRLALGRVSDTLAAGQTTAGLSVGKAAELALSAAMLKAVGLGEAEAQQQGTLLGVVLSVELRPEVAAPRELVPILAIDIKTQEDGQGTAPLSTLTLPPGTTPTGSAACGGDVPRVGGGGSPGPAVPPPVLPPLGAAPPTGGSAPQAPQQPEQPEQPEGGKHSHLGADLTRHVVDADGDTV